MTADATDRALAAPGRRRCSSAVRAAEPDGEVERALAVVDCVGRRCRGGAEPLASGDAPRADPKAGVEDAAEHDREEELGEALRGDAEDRRGVRVSAEADERDGQRDLDDAEPAGRDRDHREHVDEAERDDQRVDVGRGAERAGGTPTVPPRRAASWPPPTATDRAACGRRRGPPAGRRCGGRRVTARSSLSRSFRAIQRSIRSAGPGPRAGRRRAAPRRPSAAMPDERRAVE